jgi:uncharacterized protein YwbE
MEGFLQQSIYGSIYGKEYVNYRKTVDGSDRLRFSHKVRNEGVGNVPIVVDSVDTELSEGLGERGLGCRRYKRYGRELVLHMDDTVGDLIKEVKVILIRNDQDPNNIKLVLEDGTFLKEDLDIGSLYKRFRNNDDGILYVMTTREETILGYLKSILVYLGQALKASLGYNT